MKYSAGAIVGWFVAKAFGCLVRMKSACYASVIKGKGYISGRCYIDYPENIYIGEGSYINGGMIMASPNAKIIIGKNCLISYDVHLRTDMHCYLRRNQFILKQGHMEKDIIIEDDVWIGYGAQIMSGVTVAKGSVIAAGAVVTHDTESYGVYGGIPARRMKYRI